MFEGEIWSAKDEHLHPHGDSHLPLYCGDVSDDLFGEGTGEAVPVLQRAYFVQL